MYRWLWTITFISGFVPSVLLMFVVLTCSMCFCFLLKVWKQDFVQESERLKIAMDSPSLSEDTLPVNKDSDVVSTIGNKESEIIVSKSAVWLILFVNISVVGMVNGLYLWSTLLNLSNKIRFLIQFSFGLFTFLWRTFILRGGLPTRLKESKYGVWLFTCISIVNTVIIPCVLTALSDPSCYQVSFSIPF